MKLSNEQDAIKQAIEAGYNPVPMPMTILPSKTGFGHGGTIPNFDAICLAPAFWQALGKARGWRTQDEIEAHGHIELDRRDNRISPAIAHALEYFETKLSGGNLKAFWRSLP